MEGQRASTRTLLGFRVCLSIASRRCLAYGEITSTIVRSLFVETRFRYVSVSQLYCFEIAAFDDIGCGQPRVMYRHVLRNLRAGTRGLQNFGCFESLQSCFL